MGPRDRLFALEQFGIKLGLDPITRLLDALGHPERAWRSVHVAGTNGKGSVTAMVERGLRAAGHRTGRYTSPHLNRIEERLVVDGRPVTSDAFDEVAADVLAVVDRLRHDGTLEAWPTFFEVITAMAFEIFRREAVSVAVIEVGLGGRFDSTNVITPAVTAITSIAMDHERHLGSTLAAIAYEKAGIIKRRVPVVVGELPDAAMAVVREVAVSQEAPLVTAGREHIASMDLQDGRAEVTIRTPRATYGPVRLGLAGAHQSTNAVVAVRTLETCHERGVMVAETDVATALRDVEWPARLEWLHWSGGRQILLDAAHNPAGAAALAEYVRSTGLAPLPVVVAIMRDKDVAGMLRELASVASVFVATEVESHRSLPAVELADAMRRLHPSLSVEACPDWLAAIGRALSYGSRVVAAGSIFLVGPLREALVAEGARPATDER